MTEVPRENARLKRPDEDPPCNKRTPKRWQKNIYRECHKVQLMMDMDAAAVMTQLNSVSLHGNAFRTVYAASQHASRRVAGIPEIIGGQMGHVTTEEERRPS